MARLSGPHHFEVSAEVLALHQGGLSLAKDELEIAPALDKLRQAETLVAAGNTSAATEMERAGIARDIGVTIARGALLEGKPEDFDGAMSELRRSFDITEPYVSARTVAYSGLWKLLRSKWQRREARSAHAATLGAMDRVMLSRDCVLGRIAVGKRVTDNDLPEPSLAGDAWDTSRLGADKYFETSIAMNSARRASVQGQRKQMAPWLVRAGIGLAKAIPASLRERSLKPLTMSFLTIGRIGTELRSQAASIAAAMDPRKI